MRSLMAEAVWAVFALSALAGCASSPPSAPMADETLFDGGPGFEVRALDGQGLPVPYWLCHQPLDSYDDRGQPVEGAAASRCNFEMTPDSGRAGNEVTIAVNPRDPRNVVGGAKDYYPADAGQCVWDGVYVTHDGGRSAYEDRSVDGSPWRQLQEPDPTKLNYASQFWCTTDPVTYFDVNGRLYFLIMAYQADPVTGGKTCEDECPNGALNDWAFNRATQIVAVSDDGGDTFSEFTPLFEGTFPVAFNDKGWIAASDNRDIHVGWSLYPSGNVYFRSTDGGQTYVGPRYVSSLPGQEGAPTGFGTYVEVGSGPEVYYAWASRADGRPGPGLARSLDYGQTWEPSTVPFTYEPFEIDNGLSPRDRRGVYQWPVMAVDNHKTSPLAGSIYFVYPVGGRDGSDIGFRASFDEGQSWTEELLINDDGPGSFQFLPAISVSPGGVIDVTWFDQRTDPGQYFIDQYYAYSLDGGGTWSQNFRVRDVDDMGWDPALSKHQNGMVFLGDYIGIDSSWQAAHPVWPDGRSGDVADVYTATILRPVFANGFAPDARAMAEAFLAAHPL